MILGLITARGGSIRLPRKNAKIFCGHPLVAWSIMQSRCSRLIDETVLTTDDDEIAEIGIKYGAKVVRRPVWDNDTTAGVPFAHAIHELEKENINPDHIVSMLPTSPLKKVDDLDNMIKSFLFINSLLVNKEPEMATMSPDRECFIFKNVEDMTTNYNVPYHVIRKIADKSWNHSKICGGWGIAKKDYLMRIWENQPKFDSTIDANLDSIIFDGRKEILAYSVEPWQCFETDYDYYFRVCEMLMEEFILKGRGMEVYTRYAREFRKIVEINENNSLPLFGNSKQLLDKKIMEGFDL